ncbi:outer membrane protein assembly factor [Deinococcus sp. KNUC1210]|uniref:BamA/OMP85 family outer membrane protein n=1 Tax=Deinococcus sp. KNUC1210 TaxID=2917691 RepID=UPI001EEFFED2|nr:POTRA domain-containing protein [Deinococcus sp. KNUC1210]ULH16800.1 outer membrane protein assembly factor [Deinococcus sp. KNUC1210]
MQLRHTLAVTVALSAPYALAQSTTPATATVGDVVVKGTSDLLGNFLKASLNVQPGAALSSVNLRQVELDAVATGYIKSASAEFQTIGGQNVLVITAVPNPLIKSVNVTGVTFLPADGFKTSLANVLNIAPGATLNTVRIEQSKTALAQNYRAEGYPFTPSISTEAKPTADGSVDLNYVVDESAPISRIEVTGSTLLPQAQIVAAFQPLYDAKKFSPDTYFAAVQQIQQQYQAAGYLASGVNAQASSLEGGVLKISILEGQVSGVDLSALQLPAGSAPVLVTKAGTAPSLASLEQDVRTLSNLSGKSVGFALQPTDAQNPNRVTVLFGVADATGAPVKEIRVSGNTVVPTADLQAAIKTKVGDVFSRQLAEADFAALRDVYRKAGYEISTRDAVTFESGVLNFTIHEVRIAGYELAYTGTKNTQERVITRELPDTGTLYNDKTFRAALDRVTRLGLVRVTGLTTKSADPKNPENLTYVLAVSEQTGTRSFPISLGYDTTSGFNGQVGFQNNNLFGLGHTLDFSLIAAANDAGQVFGGSATYTIPWLDIDFLDFRKKRTSVSFTAGSPVTGNSTLYVKKADGSADTTENTGRQYTTRATGFGVNIGRNVSDNLVVSGSVNTNYNTYYLEPYKATDTAAVTTDSSGNPVVTTNTDSSGNPIVSDADRAKYGTNADADTAATAQLPTTSLTTVVGIGARYDSTTTPTFPTDGFRANVYGGYGFGSAGDLGLSWTKLEGGASTYFGLGNTLEKGFGTSQKQQAFAVRLNAGTLIGTPPPGTTYSIGYSSPNPAYELRGYGNSAFKGTNYVTTSAEYRYDLGLSTAITQSAYLIGFADAGTAWNNGETPTLGYSLGIGAQIDLGFNNSTLAQVRFDYGFSPATGSGQFHFRLGPVW